MRHIEKPTKGGNRNGRVTMLCGAVVAFDPEGELLPPGIDFVPCLVMRLGRRSADCRECLNLMANYGARRFYDGLGWQRLWRRTRPGKSTKGSLLNGA